LTRLRAVRSSNQEFAVAAAGAIAAQWAFVVLDTDLSALGLATGFVVVGAVSALGVAGTLAPDRRRRGAGLLVVGVPGVAAGIALSAQVFLAGPTTGAVVGLPTLGVALGLVAAGSLTLIRATPGWWRLSAIPVAFLIVQFALIPLGGAVFGTHAPRAPFSWPPATGATPTILTTADGVELTAWYTASTTGAAVILLPGSGGTKADTERHAGVLARHGYGVLALDARGAGESGGRQMSWGWRGDLDIAAAVEYLLTRPEVHPAGIAAIGLSMGGEQAITAAATDPRIRAVVAEGASARAFADLGFLGNGVADWVMRLELLVMWTAADLLTEASPPMALPDAVAAMGDRPLLLITGRDPEERAAAVVFAELAGAEFTRWDLPETPHTRALERHPGEWEARVIAFLGSALRLGR
jgi:dienelactone hydrolase